MRFFLVVKLYVLFNYCSEHSRQVEALLGFTEFGLGYMTFVSSFVPWLGEFLVKEVGNLFLRGKIPPEQYYRFGITTA